jgi:hypothetical protein
VVTIDVDLLAGQTLGKATPLSLVKRQRATRKTCQLYFYKHEDMVYQVEVTRPSKTPVSSCRPLMSHSATDLPMVQLYQDRFHPGPGSHAPIFYILTLESEPASSILTYPLGLLLSYKNKTS